MRGEHSPFRQWFIAETDLEGNIIKYLHYANTKAELEDKFKELRHNAIMNYLPKDYILDQLNPDLKGE